MPLTNCTIQQVLSTDNPNEGRVKINNNFECLENTISELQVASNTGATIVSASTNIEAVLSYSGSAPIYSIGVVNNPTFSSLSSTTISTDGLTLNSIASGTSVLTLGIDSEGNIVSSTTASSSYWTSGSSGSFSIKADNDSGLDATGNYAVAEGYLTIANGPYSHSEGNQTMASGDSSHVEGYYTTATDLAAHAEGYSTTASGAYSHAEGSNTVAIGQASHAEGYVTTSLGDYSHVGGVNSVASGNTSFIYSTDSLVTGDRSVVLGGQNITGTTADTVYVPKLNVQSVGSGSSLFNLGIDSSGNIVTGTTDYVSKYAVDFTFTANTASTINHNLNTTDVIVQMKDSTGSMIIPDAINNYQINSVDILVTVSDTYRVIIIGNDYGTTVTNDTLFSASDLGFVITPKPTAVINQNVVLPPNSDVTYPSPLVIGSGYTITTPPSTTLTII